MVNIFAVAFGIIIFIFSFFPVATPVTPATMNYSIVMTGAVAVIAVGYYIIYARNVYTGPIVEVSLAGGQATVEEIVGEEKIKLGVGV